MARRSGGTRLQFFGALIALAPPSLAGVSVVDAGGRGDFTQIQPAVDAAMNGDTLLVKSGTYGAFTVNQKSVWVLATGNTPVEITGTVEIRNLTAKQSVLLSGLSVRANSTTTGRLQRAGLYLSNNFGHVRARDCTFEGAHGVDSYTELSNGGSGADIASCLSVAFQGCTFQGGSGWSACSDEVLKFCGAPYDRGGNGVTTTLSITAFYDCTLQGGDAGFTQWYGDSGDGGHGCHVPTFAIFASGTSFIGGNGGYASDMGYAGGDGGDGVHVAPGARVFLLDYTSTGGLRGGAFVGSQGFNGAPTAGGGIVNEFEGEKRLCSSSVLAASGDTVAVTFSGQPGDRVYLPTASTSHWQLVKLKLGVWLLPVPVRLDHTPLAVIPASGSVVVNVPMPNLTSTESMRQVFAQAVFLSGQGQVVVGSPLHFGIMNCAVPSSDCNSNGRPDLCDVFSGDSDDCNNDFMPDECEGDCNANGVPDTCDLASGSSIDGNRNGILDDCEPPDAIWHVDAAAAPGGNGSAVSPFRTISEGVNAAVSGNVVRVRDGIYTGSANSNINFSGRLLRVESVNGPANCIIDLAGGASNAFNFQEHHDNQAATITGFTIRNSTASLGAIFIYNSSPTIENCVFTGCRDAINAIHTSTTIRGCQFIDNGGITVQHLSRIGSGFAPGAIVDCAFIRNGHIAFPPPGTSRTLDIRSYMFDQSMLVSHCVFLDNRSASSGGAISALGGTHTSPYLPARIENCLFAGNEAASGTGGAVKTNGTLDFRSCTFVGNSASASGGAFSSTGSAPQNTLDNCILWGNAAPIGPEIHVQSCCGESTQLNVRYCTIQGGQGSVNVSGGSVLNWGPGNLVNDPLFVDADGADNDPSTFVDNVYRLSSLSPCIDAGDTSALPLDTHDLDGDFVTNEFIPFDLDFNPRRVNVAGVPDTGVGPAPVVDIGAYERQ